MTDVDYHTKLLLDKRDLQNPKSFEELGYIFFGPLLFNFFAWLSNEVVDSKIILFNSREGYFLKEIYDIFKNKYNLPNSIYFKTSRKLSTISALFTKNDVYDTFKLHRYCGTLSNLLKNRFGIETTNNLYEEIDTSIKIPNLDLYIDDILINAKRVREEYKKYIFSVIKSEKQILMVDSGYQGTTQQNIEKAFDLTFKGRYINYKGNKKLSDVCGFYDFKKTNFQKNIIFFESVFVDKVGSYIDIKNGKFINEEINNDTHFFEEKIKIIFGIKTFIFEMLEKNLNLKNLSFEYADYIFDLMCKDGYIKNNSLIDIFYHDNYYVRDNMKKVVRK